MQQSSKKGSGMNIPVTKNPLVGVKRMPAMGMNTPAKGKFIAVGHNDIDKDGDSTYQKGPTKPANEY